MINEYTGVFPVNINSNLVSAQNRNRWYWSNIRTKQVGFFNEIHTDIPQPADKGILLKDILEENVSEKYYLSDKMLKFCESNWRYKERNINDKSLCLTTKEGSRAENNFIVAMRGREACLTPKRTDYGKIIRKAYEAGEITEQRKNIQQLDPRTDGKTNTLTSVQKDNLVLQIKEATTKGFIEVSPGECFDFENPNSKTRRGRKIEDKSNCLMAKETDFMQYTQTNRIRRLTPTECSRLQTIPSWYRWECSDTQQYRMLGNGWTVFIISHILSYLPKEYFEIKE